MYWLEDKKPPGHPIDDYEVAEQACRDSAVLERAMPTLVVTIDETTIDPLAHAFNCLQATMVQAYATQVGLDWEWDYGVRAFRYMVVQSPPNCAKFDLLVSRLRLKGCVDLHIYVENEQEAKFIEDQYGNLFRVVLGKFVALPTSPEHEKRKANGVSVATLVPEGL